VGEKTFCRPGLRISESFGLVGGRDIKRRQFSTVLEQASRLIEYMEGVGEKKVHVSFLEWKRLFSSQSIGAHSSKKLSSWRGGDELGN